MKNLGNNLEKYLNLDEEIRYDEILNLELELTGDNHKATRLKRSLSNWNTYRDLIDFGKTESDFKIRGIRNIGIKTNGLLVEHLKRIGFFETIKNPVPPLKILSSKVKENKNFQKWKAFLKERIEVGTVLSVDELSDILEKAGLGDFDDGFGDEVAFGMHVPDTEDWVDEDILFFLTGPSMPIQRITKCSWPDEVSPNHLPSSICCALKKENSAELLLNPFAENCYYRKFLPEKAEQVFYEGEAYNGVEGTWEEMVKLFFEIQDEIKRLTEAPEFPDSLKEK